MIWWQVPFVWIWGHLIGVATALGIGSGGIGLLTYLKHMPAPLKKSIWIGSLFDSIQDLAKNNERIGQRRDADSAFVTETKAGPGGKTSSATVVTDTPKTSAEVKP